MNEDSSHQRHDAARPASLVESLKTESTDPSELRGLLDDARRQLMIYEGFDEAIAANVRRSGELMQEALALRQQIAAHSRADNERRRIREALVQIAADAEALSARAHNLLRELASGTGISHTPTSIDTQFDDDLNQVPPQSMPPAWDAPRDIDVIAQPIADVALALALQQHLSGVDQVESVAVREFAGGVLRIRVSARRPLQQSDFDMWSAGTEFVFAANGDEVIELTRA